MTEHEKEVLTGVINSAQRLIEYSSEINPIKLAAIAAQHMDCRYCPLYTDDYRLCGQDGECAEIIYNYIIAKEDTTVQ